MTWFKIDDTFAFHPKVIAAGNEAIGLWARAGAWCSQLLTDGAVPEGMIMALGGTPEIAQKLVDVKLWDITPTGYQFHGWLEDERQPSREAVEARRAEARERMQKLRANRKGKPVEGTPDGNEDVRANIERSAPNVPNPDPTRPVTSKDVPAAPASRGSRIAENWTPSPSLLQYAAEKAPAVNVEREAERFVNYWLSASKGAAKRSWDRAFQNWLLSSQERAEAQGWKPQQFARPAADAATAAQRTKSLEEWLHARGSTLAEYHERKHESGWLDSLKAS